ncbi:hypothetical protein PVAND_013060 [Polypedilum vanderplanki]|uniref:Uncharacterized protein n=1 Tax=Polypedilum vanderplanki TaxID=319348 RepID=A0A9J6CPH1_POLVA|nr:hypothetical protein PVAND_013060 [Polypedilum vanderplanki]
MKFVAIYLIAFIAAVSSAPTQITDNNVGDIISVGVNADLNIKNQIDATYINLLLKYLNEQKFLVNSNDYSSRGAGAVQPQFKLTPEMIEMAQKFLSQQ